MTFVVFLWTCNFTENLKHFLFVHVFSFVVAFPPFLLLSGCLVLALWPFEGMCSWKSPLHVTVCAFEAFKSFLFFIIFRLNWLFRTLYEFLHFLLLFFLVKVVFVGGSCCCCGFSSFLASIWFLFHVFLLLVSVFVGFFCQICSIIVCFFCHFLFFHSCLFAFSCLRLSAVQQSLSGV